MNEFEFEIKSVRNQDNNNNIALNDFHEMMDHFRREKFRSNLIQNKNAFNFMVPPTFLVKSQTDKEKDKSFQKLNKIMKERNKRRMETLFPISDKFQNGFDSGHQIFNSEEHHFEKLESKKFESNSNFSIHNNNNNTKITFSPKIKAVINEKNIKINRKIETNDLKSVHSILNLAQEKPVKLFKNHKNLIFFKNKVIQIENDEIKPTKTDQFGREEKEDSSLFFKIIKTGNSPTKFFLSSQEKKLFPHVKKI